mmetsp:Transcript_8760/g.12753  ORF Transcript_8760/g.12753 Transcript_8760/m.12753 type:complete len:264 (+) Transcript_8760:482-1273(+)
MLEYYDIVNPMICVCVFYLLLCLPFFFALFFAFLLAISSGLRSSFRVGTLRAPMAISSACVNVAHSPGASQPSRDTPAKPTRCRAITSRPIAEHIRRICRLRPSSKMIRRVLQWFPPSTTTRSTKQGRVGAVTLAMPPFCLAVVVMMIPPASLRMSASVAMGSVSTWYSFTFLLLVPTTARSNGLTMDPLEVSRMRPVLSASSRPIGKTLLVLVQLVQMALLSLSLLPLIFLIPPQDVSTSMMFCPTRLSVVQTTPSGLLNLR